MVAEDLDGGDALEFEGGLIVKYGVTLTNWINPGRQQSDNRRFIDPYTLAPQPHLSVSSAASHPVV